MILAFEFIVNHLVSLSSFVELQMIEVFPLSLMCAEEIC